jgi:hypothetical protein
VFQTSWFVICAANKHQHVHQHICWMRVGEPTSAKLSSKVKLPGSVFRYTAVAMIATAHAAFLLPADMAALQAANPCYGLLRCMVACRAG